MIPRNLNMTPQNSLLAIPEDSQLAKNMHARTPRAAGTPAAKDKERRKTCLT